MRTEKEMLDLIVAVAAGDSRIRAAYLEGSRTNPHAAKDMFQDYDVIYVVEETGSFREDKSWIHRFGTILYMQYPEEGVWYQSDVENCYGWLMQLTDGNRLDLHVCTYEWAKAHLESYRVLVDKDHLFPVRERLTDEMFWIKKPTPDDYDCACNEFWWCLNNVAKGLWREELPYVLDMLDFHIRPMVKKMIEWQIGFDHDFSVSAGKSAKYMKQFVPAGIYRRFLNTYAVGETEALWQAVFVMCDLFREIAMDVGARLGVEYNDEEGQSSRGYLNHVSALPADADEIY